MDGWMDIELKSGPKKCIPKRSSVFICSVVFVVVIEIVSFFFCADDDRLSESAHLS